MDRLRSAIKLSASGPVRETEPGTFIRSYCFAPDFIGFSGHFPGYPILPAFIQVLAVLTLAEETKGRRLKVLTLEKAKFQKEIFPGQKLEIKYREMIAKGKKRIEASLTVGGNQAASFLLTITEEE